MKRAVIVATAIVGLMLANGIAGASTYITWDGLNWSLSNNGGTTADTSAAINANGGLDITVLGGATKDPGYDNWVLTSALPANLIQANAPWVKYTFKDTYAGNSSVGGPRGYVDTDVMVSSVEWETMWQGGDYATRSTYFLNHNVYNGVTGWANDPNNWWTGPTRTAGDHTVEFGMLTNGTVYMMFDGAVEQIIPASVDCTLFKRMYLGVSDIPGTTFTATYDSFETGTGFVVPSPEPISMIFFGTGLVAVGGFMARRRMLHKA